MTSEDYFGDNSMDFVADTDTSDLARRQFTLSLMAGLILLCAAVFVGAHSSGADHSRITLRHVISAPSETVAFPNVAVAPRG